MATDTGRMTVLHDTWMEKQAKYPISLEGQLAAATVRLCALELKAVLENPESTVEMVLDYLDAVDDAREAKGKD